MKYLIPAIVILLAMLIVSGFNLDTAPLLVCAVFAGIVMVAIKLLSPQEARNAIDWELYVAIACSFGISQALTNSGLAKVLANFLITIGEGVGIGGAALFSLYNGYSVKFPVDSHITMITPNDRCWPTWGSLFCNGFD